MVLELTRRPRRDALPEHTDYKDDGCYVAPHCRDCPLPFCRFDLPNGVQTLKSVDNRSRVVSLHEAGGSVASIIEQTGLSMRTVYRILEAVS